MQRRRESGRNCDHYHGRSGSLLCSCRLRFRYPLEFQRQMPVHQRRPAVNIDQLAGNPICLFGTNHRHRVADVRRCSQTPHGRPSAFLPFSQSGLECFRQAVQHAVFDPARADRIHGDAAAGQRHRELAHQHFHCCLCRAHRHPRLPASKSPARRERDGHNPSAL